MWANQEPKMKRKEKINETYKTNQRIVWMSTENWVDEVVKLNGKLRIRAVE